MFGFNPAREDDAEVGEDPKEGEAVKRDAMPGAKLERTRSRSKVGQPDNDTNHVLLVRAFQESVDSERGRNYRNSLPKLKQYFLNKSNASQVFAFAFFWVSSHVQYIHVLGKHLLFTLGKHYSDFFRPRRALEVLLSRRDMGDARQNFLVDAIRLRLD
jgi:hypothetical protein